MVARESDATAGLWKPLGPGYQIAYGFACELEEGHAPYDEGAMTLFDYRTDHFEKLAEGGGEQERAWLEDAEARPSFMYVMPQVRFPFLLSEDTNCSSDSTWNSLSPRQHKAGPRTTPPHTTHTTHLTTTSPHSLAWCTGVE